MKRPDFFIVGAAKAGTTSLWRYLKENPEVFMAGDEILKEPCFFSDQGPRRTMEEYLKLFEGASEEHERVGEASTIYLPDPTSAGRIYGFNRDARIIMVLRNPVDRAYSLYNWMVQEGYEYSSTFEKALEREERRSNKRIPNFFEPELYYSDYMYFSSGLYCEQVKRYLDIFGDNVLVVKFDDLVNDFDATYERVCSFLGIRVNRLSPDVFNPSRSIYSPGLQFALRKANDLLVKIAPRLFSFTFKTKESRDWLLGLGLKEGRPPKLREETGKELLERYRDDIRCLSELTGISFEEWLNEGQKH